MPINSTEKAHGAAVLRLMTALATKLPELFFSLETGKSNSAYLISGFDPQSSLKIQAGIFIKISNNRRSPWRYSFYTSHQDEILLFKNNCGEAFTVFVNGDDGIACLNFTSLKTILDHYHDVIEWVSVSRKPRSAYRISGNDGKLEDAVPMNSFPGAIIDYFTTELNKMPDKKRKIFTLSNLAKLLS
ncbi:MAG: hypothetical protein P8N23_05925 [Methylophilaceae bacterium]|nr:hypothetical protein [Methylophilaceae bacterium]